MRFGVLVFAVAVVLLPVSAPLGAEEPLLYLRSQSQLVIAGEFTDVGPGTVHLGVVHYRCRMKILEVLKGKFTGDALEVLVSRLELDEERIPELHKGKKVILFLKNTAPAGKAADWQTVDRFLGVQRHSRPMVFALKQAAEKD